MANTPNTPNTIMLKLSEPKKHSGKYVVVGTEGDMYPVFIYLRKEWMRGDLPTNVNMTLSPTT